MGRRAAMTGMWALSVAVALAWLGGAGGHLWDRVQVSHVSGAWMGLAWWTNQGEFYPPLVDESGEHFGGTRFAPLPIAVYAGAARATGEYVGSGKALNLLGMVGLMAVVAWGVRLSGGPWGLGVLAATAVLVSGTGWVAGTSIRFDGWSAGLQLLALGVVVRGGIVKRSEGASSARIFDPPLNGRQGGGVGAAGVLCGGAWVCKVSGLWAVAGIGVWLLTQRKWGAFGVLVGCWALTAGVLWGIFEWASGGRMSESLLSLSVSEEGVGLLTKLKGGVRGLHGSLWISPGMYGAVPLAALGAWATWLKVEQRVWVWGMIFWTLSAVVMFSDTGVGENHLIDGVALGTILAGQLWGKGRMTPRPESASFAVAGVGGLVVGLSLAWAVWTGAQQAHVWRYLRGGIEQWRTDWRAAREVAQLREEVGDGAFVSEDPSIPARLGVAPVVLDMFMLKRIEELRPGAVDGLIERLRTGQIQRAVMLTEFDGPGGEYYRDAPRVVRVIEECFRYVGRVELGEEGHRAVYEWKGGE
ncbi:MAG: hypothetical protein IT442_07430 [Phycisphaeraceae bacterium]|nr:hypothetical protein [Phycisphaeraceae bacterium]